MQVIGAVGHHDQHAVQRPLVADQEGQQVPGGLVSPVHVLDDQHHRAGFRQVLQHLEHLLEQPGPRFSRLVRPGGSTELRQQPGQFPAAAARQQRGHACRSEITHQLAQHGGEGGERQALRAEFQAAADQYPAPAPRDRSANSMISRDFPTPASPPTITVDGPPRTAPASAVSSAASGPERPTSTGLTPAMPRRKHKSWSLPRAKGRPEASGKAETPGA